jgi:flagellum-specific peptidoglycan hydrolase FlgJ
MREAFHGYGEFLSQNPRYKPAFNYASQMIFGLSTNYKWRDPVAFIKEVKNAWYATDSNYVGKIVSIQKGLEKIA